MSVGYGGGSMNETAEIIRAISMLCWPICIVAIAYIFRTEIKKLITKDRPDINSESVSQNDTISKKIISGTETEENSTIKICKTPISESIRPAENIIKPIIVRSYISVCKNKQSEKYFIVLDDPDGNTIKLITPKSEIKLLDQSLFTEPEELDEYEALESGKLTKSQVDIYYNELDTNEEALISSSKGYLKVQFDGFEPQYISTYRSMLSNPDTMPSIMLKTIKKYGQIKWVDLIERLVSVDGYKGTGGSLGASLRMLYIDGHVWVEGKGDDKVISMSN
jgi:hypothetical protein